MAATIRLARHGAKKRPFYRIVVTNGRTASDNRRLELLGTYDPRSNPPAVKIDAAKLSNWLRRGAQPSLTVAQLIKRSGITTEAPPPAEPTN
ncbi:MAG TPA: 30S ribosomal protein S16 [Terriglobales bacterium]|nr:30S ribosomal protein S16 [Terriglobales bacterium]